MKRLFFTLCALLSIGYAVADTRNIMIYYSDQIASIVDQNNKEYSFYQDVDGEPVFAGYYYGEVEVGTTLFFTLVEGSKSSIICTDEEDNVYDTGFSITINASMPDEIIFSVQPPLVPIIINVPGICDDGNPLGIKFMIGDMLQDLSDYCVDGVLMISEENGKGGLQVGDEFHLTSNVEIDWDNNDNPRKPYDGIVTEEDLKRGYKAVGSEVWDSSDPNEGKWLRWLSIGNHSLTYSNRTIYGKMWNTVCFPFDIDEEKMRAQFGTKVVEFIDATFSESTGLELECAYVTSMKAYTPYLVMPEESKRVLNFVGVNVQPSNGNVEAGNAEFKGKTVVGESALVSFVGVIKPEQLNADDHSVLFVTSGNKVTYPNVTANIKEFRAYFKINSDHPASASARRAPARIVIRDRQEEPTGLFDNVMQSNTTKKYMEDCRLVIEINGVRYNAQGQTID